MKDEEFIAIYEEMERERQKDMRRYKARTLLWESLAAGALAFVLSSLLRRWI